MNVNKPYKVLQTLHNAQIGVHLPNHVLIQAVEQYLKYLRNDSTKEIESVDNDHHLPTAQGKSIEDMSVESLFFNNRFRNENSFRVTFEFVEKVRRSFGEADTDNTGYLDIGEFTAFMRRTYPDMTNREAQIIFMKV